MRSSSVIFRCFSSRSLSVSFSLFYSIHPCAVCLDVVIESTHSAHGLLVCVFAVIYGIYHHHQQQHHHHHVGLLSNTSSEFKCTIQNNLLLYRSMCTIHSNVLGTVTLFAPHSLAPVCIQQQQQQEQPKDTLIAKDREQNDVEAEGKKITLSDGWLAGLLLSLSVCMCMHYHFRENPTTFIVSQSHWNRRSAQSMLQTTVRLSII